MTLMRWNNDPFLRFLAESSKMENQKRACGCRPAANVAEDQDTYRIEMTVPGYSKKEINISLEKDILTISSVRQNDKEDDGVVYTRKEFGMTSFSRSFQLNETIDRDNIKAEFKNGILTILLPKKEEVKIKKEIQIA